MSSLMKDILQLSCFSSMEIDWSVVGVLKEQGSTMQHMMPAAVVAADEEAPYHHCNRPALHILLRCAPLSACFAHINVSQYLPQNHAREFARIFMSQ